MVLEIKKAEKRFGSISVLNNFSLKVKREEILCIIGPSGCGKTTLLNIVSGSLLLSKGEIVNKSKNISYVFQEDRLSGGMRQRCSIARAFNYEADLLLMDEPFKSLDYNLRFNMIEQLLQLWKMKQNSIIFVTHEIDEALLLGDRILVLSSMPTRVIKEFEIIKNKRERNLKDKELIKIRNEIISYLVNHDFKKVYK
ncbi:ATP-binding cassette domain-containing protein [Halocella sp. SP3-1]|uniref:ABC transporter ATP-binding protein n=1 Tax=Halocella sp. SP3-1 TaxID=2382161 RepID=UPI000F74E209|nr:ATP-binding cassette domain-containing protein [Halocella sp. SP3-1]AZO96001.1 ABC transporter ATP-binding protein [Halocella sp. SP3-1]